jgi:hypothetical protein
VEDNSAEAIAMSQDDGITGRNHAAHSVEHDPLWHELVRLLPVANPIPPEIPLLGRSSFTWRTIDAELAELAYDSVGASPVGLRGSDGPRQLTFVAPSVTVEIQVLPVGERRRLLGLLVPAQEARVMIRHQDGIVAIQADSSGRFEAEDLAPGPGSLRCHMVGGQGGAPIVTDWVKF